MSAPIIHPNEEPAPAPEVVYDSTAMLHFVALTLRMPIEGQPGMLLYTFSVSTHGGNRDAAIGWAVENAQKKHPGYAIESTWVWPVKRSLPFRFWESAMTGLLIGIATTLVALAAMGLLR